MYLFIYLFTIVYCENNCLGIICSDVGYKNIILRVTIIDTSQCQPFNYESTSLSNIFYNVIILW